MNPFAFLDEFGVLEVSRPVVGGDLFVESGITYVHLVLLAVTLLPPELIGCVQMLVSTSSK